MYVIMEMCSKKNNLRFVSENGNSLNEKHSVKKYFDFSLSDAIISMTGN